MLALKRLENYKKSKSCAQKGTERGRGLKIRRNYAQVACVVPSLLTSSFSGW